MRNWIQLALYLLGAFTLAFVLLGEAYAFDRRRDPWADAARHSWYRNPSNIYTHPWNGIRILQEYDTFICASRCGCPCDEEVIIVEDYDDEPR